MKKSDLEIWDSCKQIDTLKIHDIEDGARWVLEVGHGDFVQCFIVDPSYQTKDDVLPTLNYVQSALLDYVAMQEESISNMEEEIEEALRKLKNEIQD